MLNIFRHTEIQNVFNNRALAFTLLCGLAGFVVNLFPARLFGDLSLFFGPTFSILVALSIGPGAGVIAAIISSVALMFCVNSFYEVLIFIPEAYIVGWLYRKEWNELLAVAVYWLSFGVPFVFLSIFMLSDPELALDQVGKYLMNSFLYTLVASALLWGFSVPRWLNLDFYRTYTLRTQIFTILMVSMTIPVATVSVYDTKKRQQSLLQRVHVELKHNSRLIAERMQIYLDKSKLLLEKQAELYGFQSIEKMYSSEYLIEYQQENKLFDSVQLLTPDGKVIATTLDIPDSMSKVPFTPPVVIDTVNNSVAAKSLLSVDQAYIGSGHSAVPLIMLSAPVVSQSDGKPAAILKATLNLALLQSITRLQQNSEFKQQVLIADKNNRVLFLGGLLNLNRMQTVNWHNTPSDAYHGFFNTQVIAQPVIFESELLPAGWTIKSYYLIDDFNADSRRRYRNLALVLAAIILVVGCLAAFLSYQINGPISWLLRRTLNLNVSAEQVKPAEISPFVPAELITLMRAHESAERRLKIAFETERLHQQKRARAEKANEAKSDFLSAMSHELRTPLNAISGFSQLLKIEETMPESSKSMANEIYVASQYLILLINDILDMSKIESGKLEINAEIVSVTQIIQESVPLLHNLAQVNGIEIEHEIDKTLNVIADSLKLKQVIINLVSNGIKYNRKKGKVKISFFKQNNSLCCIRVTDTGHGISPSRVNEIFEPFNRLTNEKSKIEGHGIGLVVTRKLVELMGGKIEVASKVGEGTCFAVCFPLVENTESVYNENSIMKKTLPSFELKPCRILYVEDNQLNAMVMKKAMECFPQIDYIRVENGKEGIRCLREGLFDFVFLDITLPDIDGYEILTTMQRELTDKYQHVFAVSANAMSDDIVKGRAAGFNEYVTKPIRFELLFNLVRQYQS